MIESAEPIVTVLALAFLAESLTEYLFSHLVDGLGLNRGYLRYIAALVGVGLAVTYEVDLLEQFLGVATDYPLVGEIFTGLVLGRGANFAHDLYSRFLHSNKRPLKPTDG